MACVFYNDDMDTHDALTIPEAARVLGLHPVTLRRRIQRGDLIAERVAPRLWLIPRAEVERARAGGKLRPGPKAAPVR